MRKLLLGACVLVAIAGVGSGCNSEAKTSPGDAVVIVELGTGHGSGAHIGGGLILTAAHVVAHEGAITVRDRTGAKSKASVLWSSPQKDIALLKMSDKGAAKAMPKAELFCGNLNEGDYVMLLGNPLGDEFIAGFGQIAGAARKVGKVDSAYVVNMAIVMGQSGGPLFHDGKIAGVASMVMAAPMETMDRDGKKNGFSHSIIGYGYAVPSSVVCDLLARGAA
jgi:S1-C subfamily serine protease